MPQRVMRVFVSSTFRDMHAEREELMQARLPELRKRCEARGVAWTEVKTCARGITDEQQAEGKVLPVCLAEIRHCRPFFISLLGERYGWVPDHIPPELIPDERAQLITDYLGQYGKALGPAQVKRLATADQTANPLSLRALLEELRVYGDHFTLDQRLDHYLEPRQSLTCT